MEQTRSDHPITHDEAEAILNTLARATGEGFIAINERSIILMANAELERMWGYAPGELIGQPVQILQPRRYRREHTNGVRNFIQEHKHDTSGGWSFVEALHKDGHEFPIFIRIAKVQHDGRFLLAATVRDATAFFQARDALVSLLDRARQDGDESAARLEQALHYLDVLKLADE